MRKIRVAVIGAGSTYTPELMQGFIDRKERLSAGSFAFCDIDEKRLRILSGFCGRMLRKAGMDAPIESYEDFHQAVEGADYVVAQVRVGQMAARILDERIPLKYGLLGQETTGLGGLVCAFRTIPLIREIVSAAREKGAPGAWVINFSNPSGLVAEAVLRERPDARFLGLCNIPVKMEREARKLLGKRHVVCDFVGLNHLCWITGIYDGRTELLGDILRQPVERSGLANIPDMVYTPRQLRAIGGIPCGYLNYYYFQDQMLERCMNEKKTRGEVCRDLEAKLLAAYAEPGSDSVPGLLSKRGGALYSEAAVSLIESIENDTGAYHVVNCQNRGALPMLLPEDTAEIRCRVTRDGAEPVAPRKPAGDHISGLVSKVKAYERLAAQAALTGDRDKALSAAVSHPLSRDLAKTEAALNELLEAHRQYLPRFFRKEGK